MKTLTTIAAVGMMFGALAWTAPVRADSARGLEKIEQMLTGTWKTATPVAVPGTDETTDVVMHVSPIKVDGLDHAMYVELANTGAIDQPYRQAVFALYEYKGKARLRTYEFRSAPGNIVGLWAVPEYYPVFNRDASLIATLDVELEPAGDGFAGQTPYPYPTGVGGAVEMTSRVELTPDRFVTADRGYDAQGNVVWGSDEGSHYVFERAEDTVKVTTSDTGLIQIIYAAPEGDEAQEGDTVFINYSGWTQDGYEFDSSRREGRQPLKSPIPGRLIPGWNEALPGITTGTKRRLIIPPDLAYGEKGNPRGRIPANATLIFEIECMAVQHPAPPEETKPAEIQATEHPAGEKKAEHPNGGSEHPGGG